MLYPAGLSHSNRNIIRADSWTATKAVMSQLAMLKGSRKAVGEIIPVLLATTMAVPDSDTTQIFSGQRQTNVD